MSESMTRPTASEVREPKVPDEILGFHDEPIVIDNGPIELDFGPVTRPDGEVQEVGGFWVRKRAKFAHFLVLQTKGNGDIDLFEDKDLVRNKPLTFHLGPNATTESDAIVFDLTAQDADKTVKLNPGSITFIKTNQRKLKPSGGQPLRILRITNGDNFQIDLRENGDFRSQKVSAILY